MLPLAARDLLGRRGALAASVLLAFCPTWLFMSRTADGTILAAAFTAGLVMIFRNGMPRAYHPIFNLPGFEQASRDKFFIAIEAADPQFDLRRTTAFLQSLAPERVTEVEA